MSELFTQGLIHGLSSDEMLEFFASQIEAMFCCPPNYRFFGQKARVWILRGFYPNTPIFFKLVLIDTSVNNVYHGGAGYFAKATPMRAVFRGRGGGVYDDHRTFSSTDISTNITNRMENAFFNANHDIKELITKKIKMPRCMSPKGMKLLRIDKSLRGKKREVKKH